MSENDEQDEKSESCDACSFETKALTWYRRSFLSENKPKGKWLCELCATTFAGNALEFPEQYEHRALMFHVNLVANLMMQKLGKRF